MVVVVVVAEYNVFTIADRAAHGLMPVPPPATLYLMQNMVLTAGYLHTVHTMHIYILYAK